MVIITHCACVIITFQGVVQGLAQLLSVYKLLRTLLRDLWTMMKRTENEYKLAL